MVDFRKDRRMAWRAEFADGMRRLEGRVVTVTSSLQDLSVSVTAGFVEQREYTEFAFQRLDVKIDGVEARLGERIDAVEAQLGERIDGVEARLGERIDGVEARLGRVEARLDRVEERLDRIEGRLDRIEERLARVELKLDRFIDVQTETNRLTDLRLRALER